MSNLLSTAKQVLIDGANELYEMRRSDLELDALSYRHHYSNLGEIIFQIDCYESFGELITSMENGDLDMIGYSKGDDYLIEEFLKAVKLHQ
jgi:hypothetical protein